MNTQIKTARPDLVDKAYPPVLNLVNFADSFLAVRLGAEYCQK
jgi:hypothetical protein